MITKASANRSFPIPNEGGFSPPGGGVFKSVVIRSPSPPSQTPESIHPLVAKLCGRKAPCRKARGKMGMGGKENNRRTGRTGDVHHASRFSPVPAVMGITPRKPEMR